MIVSNCALEKKLEKVAMDVKAYELERGSKASKP